VIGMIGLSISPRRAKSLVAAFRAMPPEISAEMDAAGVTLASRSQWIELGKKGRDGAAEEIWAAIADLDRPELLTRACMEALEHPSAEVDEVLDLAASVHDRSDVGSEFSADPIPGAVDLTPPPVIDIGEYLEAMTSLASKLRAGDRLEAYEAGSLRLRIRELAELLDGDIETTAESAAA